MYYHTLTNYYLLTPNFYGNTRDESACIHKHEPIWKLSRILIVDIKLNKNLREKRWKIVLPWPVKIRRHIEFRNLVPSFSPFHGFAFTKKLGGTQKFQNSLSE